MTVEISQKDYEVALARGKRKLDDNHAQAARYIASEGLIELQYSNGMTLRFMPQSIKALQDLSEDALHAVYLTPGGEGLIFDKSDVAINVTGLVGQLIPLDAARYAVAAANGKVASAAKADAARSNGAKGGRPPRRVAV